jgi:hypothetical protein
MIYIVIRKTLDWANESAFRAQIPEEMRAAIGLWNATFNMPYHQYRSELRRIAQLNLARIQGAACVSQNEIPEGAVAVPVDDDDWFAPGLAQTLERSMGDHLGCYWPSRFLEVPISLLHRLGQIRRTLFPSTKPRWLCTTNNYAIVYGPKTADLLNSHVRASHWFLAHPSAVIHIGQPLSLMNRTLASTTQLRSRPSRAILMRKHRRYSRLYRRPAPSDLVWCEPYLAMMIDLHAQLHPRCG